MWYSNFAILSLMAVLVGMMMFAMAEQSFMVEPITLQKHLESLK